MIAAPVIKAIETTRREMNVLEKYKKDHGLTVQQIAEAVGLSKAGVKMHLNGKARPKSGAIKRYVQAFGLRAYDLFSIGEASWPVDLMGQKFGRLMVIDYVGASNDDHPSCIAWGCRCECGNESIVRSSHLTSGHTQSCGCLGREKLTYGGQNKLSEGMAAANTLRYNYQKSARQREIEWKLTPSEFLKLTSENCFYCGCPPGREFAANGAGNANGTYIYNGIDRVDNTRGYEMDNVVSCCTTCNVAKATLSQEEFFSWIERVYRHSLLKERSHDTNH